MSWLKRWFGNIPVSDVERGIFRYRYAGEIRAVDPIEIDQRLKKHGGENWTDLLSVLSVAENAKVDPNGRLAAEIEKQREAAVIKLVDLVRTVFSVSPIEVGGMTGAECLRLLADYLAFLVKLKERYIPLPVVPARPAQSPTEPDTVDFVPCTSQGTKSA